MNWDRIQGNRKQFKGKAKEQRGGKLTDDDLDVVVVSAISSSAAFRSATELPRTKPSVRSTRTKRDDEYWR